MYAYPNDIITIVSHSCPQRWYVSVALNKTYTVSWIEQLKKLLLKACAYLKELKVYEHCFCKFIVCAVCCLILNQDIKCNMHVHMKFLISSRIMKYDLWSVIGDLVWERWSYISNIDHLVCPIPRHLKHDV